MSFGFSLLPLLFLLFLMIYQAAPDSYYKTIDETFNKILEDFEEEFEIGFDSQNATFETAILLFIKAAVLSAFGVAIMVVWLASIIPFSAETLIWIYFGLLVIGNIPWGYLIGIGLLIKDWLDKRRKKNDS